MSKKDSRFGNGDKVLDISGKYKYMMREVKWDYGNYSKETKNRDLDYNHMMVKFENGLEVDIRWDQCIKISEEVFESSSTVKKILTQFYFLNEVIIEEMSIKDLIDLKKILKNKQCELDYILNSELDYVVNKMNEK